MLLSPIDSNEQLHLDLRLDDLNVSGEDRAAD